MVGKDLCCYRINYYATQPALNYGFENPDPNKPWQIHYKDDRLKPLREEIIKIFLFWAKNGADGFRCDLAGSLIKNQQTEEHIKWLWNTIIGRVKEKYPDSIFMAEWGRPDFSVGQCGFDLDYLTHEHDGYNCLFRYEKDTNIVPYVEKGNSYFREEGLGDITIFTDYVKEIDKRKRRIRYSYGLSRYTENIFGQKRRYVESHICVFIYVEGCTYDLLRR